MRFNLKSLSLNLNVETLSGTLTLYVRLRVEPLCGTWGNLNFLRMEPLFSPDRNVLAWC